MNQPGSLPDRSNFFASLTTSLSKASVARLYEARGWSRRQCSRADFEVGCSWAELTIDGDVPILLHGPVANVAANAHRILQPLQEAGIAYTAECYGENKELLETFEHGE